MSSHCAVNGKAVALLLLWTLVGLVVLPVDASAFLKRTTPEVALKVLNPKLQGSLLGEIEDALGSDHRHATERRLRRIAEALRPTFASMPKNEHGKLEHAAVRYVLHRLFIQQHGWSVMGLNPMGEAWSSSSPSMMFKDWMPEHALGLFEGRMGGHGLDLHELAVLAGMFEHLVHNEAMDRLRYAYQIHELSVDSTSTNEQVEEVIDTYMLSYIFGFNISTMTPTTVQEQRKLIERIYPAWPASQKFTREVKQEVLPAQGALAFASVGRVVEEIGERFGLWQDSECRALKDELVGIEDRGTGRVRLGDFYRSALQGGQWQFTEQVEYLRNLGALDVSDATNLRVIIPNYITGPSNCVASTSFYQVCCRDECEDLFGHLEKKIAAPVATPEQISAAVAALPSISVPGNRTLQASLLRRLDEIAEHHGGHVLLHGRLFAQWMHHAYPRECPFPHMSGTTKHQTVDEWSENGGSLVATAEEMQQHFEALPQHRSEASDMLIDEEELLVWTMEEELVISSPRAARSSVVSKAVWRGMVLLLFSVVAGFFRTFVFVPLTTLEGKPLKEHYV